METNKKLSTHKDTDTLPFPKAVYYYTRPTLQPESYGNHLLDYRRAYVNYGWCCMFRGLVLYTAVVIFFIEWSTRKPWPYSIVLYGNISIAQHHRTNNNPSFNLSTPKLTPKSTDQHRYGYRLAAWVPPLVPTPVVEVAFDAVHILVNHVYVPVASLLTCLFSWTTRLIPGGKWEVESEKLGWREVRMFLICMVWTNTCLPACLYTIIYHIR